ncbi:MAG: methionine adenosyltransferase [Anaeroplasma sp.]|uniref:methionine adenosyltransferase n=1 Tax=Anaeroplasma sp. TaxID=1872523 RepID=UPI002A912A3C|nr:methionine adenosyltransferase [Anaeroplasma sp.]MDY5982975.1 methionine adenosyltransferase [Anaeroplasma sp.]
MKRFFTSESVTEGHPDKIADQISDAILDDILKNDPNGRVACETICTTGMVMVFGEITTNHYVDVQKIVRDTVTEIGYVRGKYGFDADNLAVLTAIDPQSPDIAMGVDESSIHEQGAGDQGIMFGYACKETEEYMPLAITLAHKLCHKLTEVRKNGTLSYLRPDGKSQVTVEYDDDGSILRIDTVLISTQHSPEVELSKLAEDIKKYVVDEVIPSNLVDKDTKFLFNPTGRFVIGGPAGDSGLTGRKIIVDTYGGAACHGGGAFSGKDPSKVDRSASYMARYIAKNVVAAGLCDKCQIQLSYAIGVAEPTSVLVDTFGTANVDEEFIQNKILEIFDLTPKGIIRTLDLKRPIYKQTAAYGHFGRTDIDLPWEHLDKVDELKTLLK